MSLKNNFYIIAISLFVQLPFALLIALMISDKLRGAAFLEQFFSSIYFSRNSYSVNLGIHL